MEKRDTFNIFKFNKSKSNTQPSILEYYQNNINDPTTSNASNVNILISVTADSLNANIHMNVSNSGDTFNGDLDDLVSGPNRPIIKVNTKLHLVLGT
jgi:ribosome-binding factor A